ncbi:MAG: HNH endonuclease [Gemmatimonadales bacterium]
MTSYRDNTLLRMRANDAGFNLPVPAGSGWLGFGAAGNLASVWLAGDGNNHIVASGPWALVAEVGPVDGCASLEGPMPDGAAAAWACHGDRALDALLRRIALLGQVLPNQPQQRWEQEVEATLASMPGPRTTERVAEVKQRVGQDLFRDALEKYWGGRCAITGVSQRELLRASHAKPWKDCTDAERLDVHNGLLLAAHLDAAFDAGLIGIGGGGEVLVSERLGELERRVLGLTGSHSIQGLRAGHGPYLEWHRIRMVAR